MLGFGNEFSFSKYGSFSKCAFIFKIPHCELHGGGGCGGGMRHHNCKGIVEVMVCNSGGQTHRIIEVFFLSQSPPPFSKVIYPMYYKNSNESYIFIFLADWAVLGSEKNALKFKYEI